MHLLLTGCSGAGKSTLLDEMARRGWATVAEPGRRVIALAERGEGAFPWEGMPGFLRCCANLATRDLAQPTRGITLCDRGSLDAALGLARSGHGPKPDASVLAGYGRPVILAPPWPEIFTQDAQRRHDFDSALAEYEDVARWLHAHCIAHVILPRLSVAARADWLEGVLSRVAVRCGPLH